MARTKTTPRRIVFRGKNYIIKQKLETPKVVKFGSKTVYSQIQADFQKITLNAEV